MNKRNKILVGAVFALALLAVVVPVGLAEAAEQDMEGTGWIWAWGAGEAVVEGDGKVVVYGHGVGVVWVSGAERLVARGTGRRVDLPDGTTRFEGWRGTIKAFGGELRVRMVGAMIHFYARGTGSVFLRGHGRYIVNGHKGTWSDDGITIDLKKPDTDTE